MNRETAAFATRITPLTALNLAVFALVLFLVRPLWQDIDAYIVRSIGTEWPWMATLFSAGIALAAVLLLAARALRKRRAKGKGRGFSVALALSGVLLAALADALLVLLVVELGKDRGLIEYRVMGYAPHAAAVAALALFILVLPRFGYWQRPGVRWGAFGCIILAGGVVLYNPLPPRITVGPWLQFAGDGAMTVFWMTDRPATSVVEYGEGFELRAQASYEGLYEVSRLHRVTLTGLAPGERVNYRVKSQLVRGIFPNASSRGATVVGDAHTFAVPDPTKEDVSFLVVSDLHEARALLPGVLNAAEIEKCDFVVFDGDAFNHLESEYQLVTRLLRPAAGLFASEKPFILVRGNHETDGPFARELASYVSLPHDPWVSSLRVGPAALLVLDTGDESPDDHYESGGLKDFASWHAQQFAQLDALTNSPAWGEAPFRILLAHIPVDDSHAAPGTVARLESLGVDLQIAGHWHGAELVPGRFPVAIVSGEVTGPPDTYPVGVVTVTAEKVTIDMMTESGRQVAQWEVLRNGAQFLP